MQCHGSYGVKQSGILAGFGLFGVDLLSSGWLLRLDWGGRFKFRPTFQPSEKPRVETRIVIFALDRSFCNDIRLGRST